MQRILTGPSCQGVVSGDPVSVVASWGKAAGRHRALLKDEKRGPRRTQVLVSLAFEDNSIGLLSFAVQRP